MDQVEHHYADLEEVRLHYVTAGAGEPLVLLHGWPQTWWEWRRVMPRLTERFQVIAPDLRGLGDSSRPNGGYDKRTVAADIGRLMDLLGHERWQLAGHDWGGAVAYALAFARPQAVRRLAIVDVVIPGTQAASSWDRLSWHIGFHALPDLPEALVQGREELYLSWFYRNLAHDPNAIGEEDIREYVRTYSRPGALRAGFNLYRAFAQDSADSEANMRERKLAMPVLAVQGAGPFYGVDVSKARTRHIVGDAMRKLADDVTDVLVERSGHWIPEEQPDVLADHLLEFFD